MPKHNRNYKDSMFVDLFYEDETAQENLLSLYNALHDSSLQEKGMIQKMRVEDILYKNFRNDISFQAEGKIIVFGEHQSSINPNMPLRCLLYMGRAYEQLTDDTAKYGTKLVKIPTPECYVFYNGVKEYPLEQELRLSDAFLSQEKQKSMELKVQVININSEKGHKILGKCQVLKEYSLFVEAVRKHMGEKDAFQSAIEECIGKGILSSYLKRKGSEVTNMLTAEYKIGRAHV